MDMVHGHINATAADMLAIINCTSAVLHWVKENAMEEVYQDYRKTVGENATVTKEQIKELLDKMDEILENFHGQIMTVVATDVLADIIGDIQNGK